MSLRAPFKRSQRMSVALAFTQPVSSDVPFTQTRPSLCLGSPWCSTPLKHSLSNHFILRAKGRLSGVFGRLQLCGEHGCRVRRGVLARNGSAPAGTVSTVVGSELIVLGLSSDSLVSVAPVGSTNGAPGAQPSPNPTPVGGVPEPNTVSLLAAAEIVSMESGECCPFPAAGDGNLPDVAKNDESAEAIILQQLTDSATVLSASSSVGRTGSPSSSSAKELGTAVSVYASAQRSSSKPGSGAGDMDGTLVSGQKAIAAHVIAESLDSSTGQQQHHHHHHQQQQQTHSTGLWKRVVDAFSSIHWGKLWALTLLSVSYVHQATTGFALPAMLPMISNELHLTDMQGALLTTGYSYLYAVALVPIGLLADRVSRPKLLAAGLALWSVLTCTASSCRSFGELILARVGFAAAQGAQNPVCFSLIPELFPVNKSTALSLYNCAIYVGRALSFAAVLLARHLHDNDQAHLAARGGQRMETRLDHLDRADLHSLSIMHTAGDMAAATPDKEFNFPLWEYGSELPDSAWRQVLRWIAVPGFLIGLAMMATLREPRQAVAQAAPGPVAAAVASMPTPAAAAAAALPAPPLTASTAVPADKTDAAVATAAVAAVQKQPTADAPSDSSSGILALLRSPGFMSVTLAAALNDVGSYALIAWQSTFYERVYGLEPSSYAPVLAALLPLGGILGGVGGGYLADRLSRSGRRVWVTAGATCVAAPCLAVSCLAPSPEVSYAALLVGFALSEMWRAPSAVMARGLAPPSMGSTASAVYLCVRNLLGGLGPLLVACLIGVCGLQQAMMVVPVMYLASGFIFAEAEKLYDLEMNAMALAS